MLGKLLKNFSPRDKKILLAATLVSAGVTGFISWQQIQTVTAERLKNPLTALDTAALEGAEPVADTAAHAEVAQLSLPFEDLSAHKTLIELFNQNRYFGKSLSHIERIAPYFEEDLSFQTEAANAYLATGQPEKALTYFEKAVTLKNDDPRLHADLALAIFKTGQTGEALTRLTENLKKFPNHPVILTQIATLNGELYPKNQESAKLFEEALRQDPRNVQALYQYGRYLMNQGNYNQALQRFLPLQDLDPLNSKVHARLGMIYSYIHKYDEAEKYYRTVLAMNAKDYNTWYNLGELYMTIADEQTQAILHQSNKQRALEAFLACLELFPRHSEAHFQVGLLMNGNRAWREAILHFNQASEQLARVPNLWMQIGIAYEGLGEWVEALENIRRAYELDPLNKVISSKMDALLSKMQSGPLAAAPESPDSKTP